MSNCPHVWQSMDTAPKDGEPIVVCGGNYTYEGKAGHGPYHDPSVRTVRWRDGAWRSHIKTRIEAPAFWITPLPRPPKDEP